jgi:hypothetical protein
MNLKRCKCALLLSLFFGVLIGGHTWLRDLLYQVEVFDKLSRNSEKPDERQEN